MCANSHTPSNTDGLVAEHRKYINEGAISVTEQRRVKDRPQHDRINGYARYVCDATFGELPKIVIAKGHTHHRDKKYPKDKNRTFPQSSQIAPSKPQDTKCKQTEPRGDKSTARPSEQDCDKDQEQRRREGPLLFAR